MRGRGRQELRPRVCYEKYGLPDMGVYIIRVEGRNMGLGPQGRREPTPRLQRRWRRLWRTMVEVSRSGSARRRIFCRNVRQSTARIDRTVANVSVCRAFLRSVLTAIITPSLLHPPRPYSGRSTSGRPGR